MKQKREIIRYVRDAGGHPYATIICTGPDKIAWSICHTKEQFNKKKGKAIAIGRLVMGSTQAEKMVWLSRRSLKVRDAVKEVKLLALTYFSP